MGLFQPSESQALASDLCSCPSSGQDRVNFCSGEEEACSAPGGYSNSTWPLLGGGRGLAALR